MKAFGYVRKSPDDKEGTEVSIKNQKDLIENYCNKNNIKLIDTFEDLDLSGSDRFRKGFTEMILEILKSNVEIIIVKDKSRFCRDTAFFLDTLKDLRAYNKKVFSIMDNHYLDPEDFGDMVTSMVDEKTIIDGRKKARLLLISKQEKGLPCIPAPYGYKYKTIKKEKVWVLDEKKADIVKKSFDLTLKKLDYKNICKELDISVNLYYKILKNRNYLGFVSFYNKIKDSSGKTIRKELVEYKGVHKQIVSEELFNKVN